MLSEVDFGLIEQKNNSRRQESNNTASSRPPGNVNGASLVIAIAKRERPSQGEKNITLQDHFARERVVASFFSSPSVPPV